MLGILEMDNMASGASARNRQGKDTRNEGSARVEEQETSRLDTYTTAGVRWLLRVEYIAETTATSRGRIRPFQKPSRMGDEREEWAENTTRNRFLGLH